MKEEIQKKLEVLKIELVQDIQAALVACGILATPA